MVSEVHASGTSQTIDGGGSRNSLTMGDINNVNAANIYNDTRGSENDYVEGKRTIISKGDTVMRVGTLNYAAANQEAFIQESIDEEYKSTFETQRADPGGVYSSKMQEKKGIPALCPGCSGDIAKKRIAFGGPSIQDIIEDLIPVDLIELLIQQVFPDFEIPSIPLLNLPIIPTIYPPTALCKVCTGESKGKSPSSQDGTYDPDPKKEEMGQAYVDSAPALAKAEADIGEGGNYIAEVTKNVTWNVGCALNKKNPIRVDPKGKISGAGVAMAEEGPYDQQMESPLIEPKHVDDLSGGTFTLLANNKAAFMVGAGGIKFQTLGLNEIHGAMTNITGDQVNISSSNEVNLASSSRLNLEGKILSLKSGSGQVFIDGNLGVRANLMVQGGAMVNGPLMCNGITAPMTLQKTEELMQSFGTTNDIEAKKIGYMQMGTYLGEYPVNISVTLNLDNGTGVGIGTCTITLAEDVPVYSMGATLLKPDADSVRINPHRHMFRNLPLNLLGATKDLNTTASEMMAAVDEKGNALPVIPNELFNGVTGPNPDISFNDADDHAANMGGETATKNSFVNIAPHATQKGVMTVNSYYNPPS
jgi:hypothetical protein